MQLHGRMSLKVDATFFQTTHFDIEHEGSELFNLRVLNKLIMEARSIPIRGTAIHTGARQLHPNYTSPTKFLHSGCCVAVPHGKTNCVRGRLGRDE